jgi:hypothetical protein
VRVAKTFALGEKHSIQAIVDIYNVLNSNPVSLMNTTYGPDWQNVESMMPGRFFKFGTQFNF